MILKKKLPSSGVGMKFSKSLNLLDCSESKFLISLFKAISFIICESEEFSRFVTGDSNAN